MISSQIAVGTTYAATTYGTFNPNTDYLPRMSGLVQAKVLSAPKGGQVEVLFPTLEGRTATISTRRIAAEWNDYAQQRNQYLADAKAAKAANTARASRLSSYLPEGAKLPYWAEGRVYADGSQTTDGKLSIRELEALLQAAYEHGAASAK